MNDKRWKMIVALLAISAILVLALTGCSSGKQSSTAEASSSDAVPTAQTVETHTVTLHRGLAAAHGDKCFTQIVVATADDGTILAANVDEYQFIAADTAGVVPVPNSDAGFGQNYAAGYVLMSKTVNSTIYSAMIAAKAGGTQEWAASMQAIEAYAVGKTPAEISNVSGPDAVSGATLEDTANYLAAIATVAQDDTLTTTGTYEGDGSDLKMVGAQAAAHGDKCFTSVVTLVQNGTIVAASVDEYQFLASDTAGIIGVPNSDAAFGQNYATGQTLCSKSLNNEVYSAMIKAKAGATQTWLDSMSAIESYVAGKMPDELASVDGPDAVSGATLADTANYVKAIADTAAEAA